jgi:glycosyltransferase involved in cell wall biosynthesis
MRIAAPAVPTRVAAVIPVFTAKYLSEALDSIFAQTRIPDEVIVVDDGSPEPEALAAAVGKYPNRVRLLRQPNRGAGAARNIGVRATAAELIAFLDADDRWEPAYLEVQLRELQAHPGCDVVYSNAVYFGDTPIAGRRFADICPSHGEVTATSLLALECHIPLSAVVGRRRVLIDSGLFDETLRRGQDFDLWLRLALSGVRFTYHPAVLMQHRVHESNLSGSHVSRMERAAHVFTKALADLPLSAEQRAVAQTQIRLFEAEIAIERGKECLSRGEFGAARDALMRGRRTARRWKVGAALIGLRVAPHLFRRLYLARALQRA